MFKIENSTPDELEESKGRKVECHCFSVCCRPAAKSIGLANGKDSGDNFYTRGNCDKGERR
ncbi:hypothetical protein [Peribacillus simplex]|uniref:hypothetical protein n=1 Tax=Peribacillus simplex TaxID=1478 RepID=UPI0011A496B3|nr:hypothetical protein [Peribacillus simplex]